MKTTTDSNGIKWTVRPDGQRVQVLDNENPLQTMIPKIVKGHNGRFQANAEQVAKQHGSFTAKVMIDVRVYSDGRVVADIPRGQSRVTSGRGIDPSTIFSDLSPRIQRTMGELPWLIVNNAQGYYDFSYPLSITIQE